MYSKIFIQYALDKVDMFSAEKKVSVRYNIRLSKGEYDRFISAGANILINTIHRKGDSLFKESGAYAYMGGRRGMKEYSPSKKKIKSALPGVELPKQRRYFFILEIEPRNPSMSLHEAIDGEGALDTKIRLLADFVKELLKKK